MTTDVASLAIRVESLQVDQASKGLNRLSTSGAKAEKATAGLTGTFARLLGPLAASVTVLGTLKKVVDVQREFDVLNAGLITATGSSEKAAVAFQALTDFAAKTPYDLKQAVAGFTELVNLGLTPSEKALTSYGNTASAMGKDLSQMIEAVADATTGEFERLKEFGIKAHQQGDQISFVFQGVTTTVGNNAKEIEGYLTSLGENQFAGAMQKRMDTLDGAISNLGDTWDGLFRAISSSGIGDMIESAVRQATDALQGLTDMVASGELEGYLRAIGAEFDGWGDDVKTSIRAVSDYFRDRSKDMKDDGFDAVGFIIDAFRNLPANVRAFVQLMTVEVASQFEKIGADAKYLKESLKAVFTDDTQDAAAARYVAELKRIDGVRDDSIQSILKERDASVESSHAQAAAAEEAGKKYREQQALNAKANEGKDRLAGFKVGGSGGKASSRTETEAAKRQKAQYDQLKESLLTEEEAVQASYEKRRKIILAQTAAGSAEQRDMLSRLDKSRADDLKKIADEHGQEFEALKESLQTQEQAIQASYDKRLAIVLANTQAGSKAQADLEAQLKEQRDKALADVEASRQRERDGLYTSLMTEEESLKQAYDRKKQAILDSTAVTEEERQDLLRRLQKQFDDEQDQMQQQHIQSQLTNAAAMFGGLADLAKAYAGEQSGAYKTLFAISKAFSITQAVMSIATGIAKAQELGFPANLAAMAQVAATGASALATIKGSQYSGAYDQGGGIPAGKVGIVGEYGPELVKGPASVTGRVATARAMRESGGDGGGQTVVQPRFRIINQFDTHEVVGGYLGSDPGEEAVMNVVRKNPEVIRQLAGG